MKKLTAIPHFYKGFTLQELMIGLAVFMILGALGVPGFIGFVRNGELSNSTTSLFSDMYLARSVAIKRKAKVTVCRSSNAMVDNPVCGGANNDWSGGWIVFVDVDGVANVYDGNDELIKVGAPPSNNVQIMSNNNADQYIEYIADGTLNINLIPSVYAVCADHDNDGTLDTSSGREIRITPAGRPEITKGNIADCTAPV